MLHCSICSYIRAAWGRLRPALANTAALLLGAGPDLQAPSEGGAAPKAQKKRRKGKDGKKMKATVDQPDEVQIRGKVG